MLIVNKWHLGIYEILFCMRLLCNIYKSIFIANLCIFPLILQRDIVSINRLTLILKIIGQCVTDKNNDVSYEGLDIHVHQYHCSSYRTSCYTSDNVLLDLLSSRYSVYLEKYLCSITRDFISQNVHEIQRLYPMTTHST